MSADPLKINPLLISDNDLSLITANVLVDMVESGLDEGYTFELKQYTQDNKQAYKIRQTIAAFANRQGGFLIIGIKDKKSVESSEYQSVDKRIVGVELTEESRNWIDNICSKELVQPLVGYEVDDVTVEGKKVIVIKVPPYILGPAGIKGGIGSPVEFWQRGNASNIPMDYLTIITRVEKSPVSLIKSAILDLMDISLDIKHLESVDILSSIIPQHLSSVIVDNRHLYYGILTEYSHIIVTLNNLRKTVYATNHILDLSNNAQANGVTINNSSHIQEQFKLCLKQTKESADQLVKELTGAFPDIVAEQAKNVLDSTSSDDDKGIEKNTDEHELHNNKTDES